MATIADEGYWDEEFLAEIRKIVERVEDEHDVFGEDHFTPEQWVEYGDFVREEYKKAVMMATYYAAVSLDGYLELNGRGKESTSTALMLPAVKQYVETLVEGYLVGYRIACMARVGIDLAATE